MTIFLRSGYPRILMAAPVTDAALRALRDENRYAESLYWCHQMFFHDWDTSPIHIVPEDEEP